MSRFGSRLARSVGCVALVCLVAAGCGSDDTTADGSAATTTEPAASAAATMLPADGDGDVAGLVDIGDGRTLYLECRGTGSPTVVLIAGSGNAADSWSYAASPTDPTGTRPGNDAAVYPTTARSTRVCAYDRPGTQLADGAPGRSPIVPQPTSTQDDVADLHALLRAADVPGPSVLVAHSLGGLIATTYARTYPDDVAGLVLVDPASQHMKTTMGPAAWGQYVQAALARAQTGGETVDLDASNATLEALPPLPAMPVVVLSSDQPWFILPFGDGGAEVDYSNQLLESQTLLAVSLGATHITKTGSAHDIYIENAALVNEQICAVATPTAAC